MSSQGRTPRVQEGDPAAGEAELARVQGEVVHEILQAIGRGEAPQAVYERGPGWLARALGADRTALLLADDHGTMRLVAWRGLAEGCRAAAEGHTPWPPDDTAPGPVMVADVEDDEAWAAHRSTLRAEGIRALGFLPLHAEGRLLGACVVAYAEPRELTARELQYAQTIAGHIAAAIALARFQEERSHLVEQLAGEKRTLESVLRIGGILSAELDLERLMQTLTDEATALCGANFGAFFYNVVSEDRESYLLYTLAGAPKEAFSRFGIPRKTPLFGPTFAGEGVTRSDDITRDPRYGRMEPHRGMPKGHLPVKSYLAVPVISRSGRVHGTLFFGHAEPGRFTDAHERVLVGVASQAAIALDNAELFQKAERAREEEAQRARHAALVAEVGLAIAQGGTLAAMLDRCCSALVSHLDAACARIWILDAERDVLVLGASAGLDEPAGGEVAVGELAIGRIAAERMPYLTNDVPADPGLGDAASAERRGLVAFAGHPLLLGDRLVGVMAVFAQQPLEDSAAQTLASVSNHLAVGLDRLWADQERASLLDAERSARRRAEAAARSRDEVIAVVSHDLRNPLTTIVTSTELLEELVDAESEGGAARTCIETIRRQSQQMSRMIGDLLDVASIESGTLQIDREPLDAGGVVSEIVTAMRPVAQQRALRLAAEVEETPALFGDRERLLQVLSNLVGNALKFTDAGTVTVQARPVEEGVGFAVSDTGPGIEPEQIPYLFNRFWHASPGRSGVGLGLSIAKGIVEAHGGRIWAESVPGEGTTFRFTVPLASSHEAPAESRHPSPQPLDRPTVLVVDDDAAIRETLAELLEDNGFAIASAENGREALALLRGRIPRPAVIVLDLMMPVMDGHAFRAVQQQDPELSSIPVVVFTAFGARAAATPLGAAAYLEKPVRPHKVIEALRAAIDASSAARRQP